MDLLRLMLAGFFPDSMTTQCSGILPDGTRCTTRRLHLSRNGLCPECQQRQDENDFAEKGGGRNWLGRKKKKE